MATIPLEACIDGTWHLIGHVDVSENNLAQGYLAPGTFTYELEYLDLFGTKLHTNGYHAVSLRYPLNYGSFQEKRWPSFLLDLIPTGAARANWLKRLNISDGHSADFELLSKGAINPPGHIRVRNNQKLFSVASDHPGFPYEDVINRGVDFIDYAEKMGAIVSGTSGAQGEAPKFLLVKDDKDRWHGDGAVQDKEIKESWLVKFPRGKKKRDYQILLAESQLYKIAHELGVNTFGPLRWENDTLFILRFDRTKDENGGIRRFGLESIVSAAGITEFGARLPHEGYLEVISKYCSNPTKEVLEYVFRDFLNIVCGNTDNHGRNTAFIKRPNGTVELAPLFDFAPMSLDDSGIPRATKWKEEDFQIPNFKSIANCLAELKIAPPITKDFFKSSKEKLANLINLFDRQSVEEEVKNLATKKYDDLMKALTSYVSTL